MIIRNNNSNNGWFLPMMSNLFDTPIMGGDLKLVDRNMRTDVIEKESEYTLSVELAGFKKEQVSLEIEDGYLVINAVNSAESSEEEGVKYLRRERTSRSVKRAFYIGDGIDDTLITASMADGVLTVTLPKKKPVTPDKRSINID